MTGRTARAKEINLLDTCPKVKRPIEDNRAAKPEHQEIARQFGRDYFDGDRRHGYGGYRYDGRWITVASRMCHHYDLKAGDWVLDIGCAKGFLLHDLKQAVPGLEVTGLDVSSYAIMHGMDDVRSRLVIGTAADLPFANASFDLVLSINTIHNLERDSCIQALREIERVSRRFKYVQVDSWFNEDQRRNLSKWVLTARTYCEPDGWRALFVEAGYTGEYFWTVTE
jgi:SAM-dependent methyltransferase